MMIRLSTMGSEHDDSTVSHTEHGEAHDNDEQDDGHENDAMEDN
jgi:hypothetical protein